MVSTSFSVKRCCVDIIVKLKDHDYHALNGLKFAIGIVLMIIAVGMFFYIEDIKDDKRGFFGTTIDDIVQMCDAGWGDIFNLASQCMKVQLFFYSPWIAGIIGIIFLAKAGPYRRYGRRRYYR